MIAAVIRTRLMRRRSIRRPTIDGPTTIASATAPTICLTSMISRRPHQRLIDLRQHRCDRHERQRCDQAAGQDHELGSGVEHSRHFQQSIVRCGHGHPPSHLAG
jgi:hypothetical protein